MKESIHVIYVSVAYTDTEHICLSIRRNKNHSSSKLVVRLNLVSFWIKRKKEKYKKNHIYICSIHQGGPVS